MISLNKLIPYDDNLPSALYTRDKISLSSGSFTSTCIPIPIKTEIDRLYILNRKKLLQNQIVYLLDY